MTDSTKENKPAKATADWELIEKLYRANLLSLREIAKAADDAVTEGAIRKRAKKDGWTRDLGAKIAQKAEELVRKEVVRTASTQLTPASEREVIDANAQLQYQVRMDARQDVVRLENLVRSLMTELEAETGDVTAFTHLGELLDESGPDANGKWKQDKRNEVYMKVISAAWRVDAAKKLVEMTEKLIKLKYQVFGIPIDGDDNKGESSVDALLAGVLGK